MFSGFPVLVLSLSDQPGCFFSDFSISEQFRLNHHQDIPGRPVNMKETGMIRGNGVIRLFGGIGAVESSPPGLVPVFSVIFG
jgi:hypothetical protein